MLNCDIFYLCANFYVKNIFESFVTFVNNMLQRSMVIGTAWGKMVWVRESSHRRRRMMINPTLIFCYE